MNVLLIHPKLKSYQQPKLPPLGLLFIAAFLEKSGHRVRVIDFNVNTKKETTDQILSGVDIVGITATTPLIKEAWRLTKIIKKRNIPVVLGGPHPSALPEESLANGADIVCVGEGEETFAELLEKWPHINGIMGIVHRKNDRVVHEQRRPPLKDIDSLPFPAYHLLEDLEAYTTPQPIITEPMRTLTMVTSRGCPYLCNYCFKGVFGQNWRAHSAKYVVDLWQYLYEKFQIQLIGIEDDTFNLDYSRVQEICRLLKQRNIRTVWTTAQGMRADRVDKELLSAMKETGFIRTGFGIEAGSQEMVTRIGKSLDLEKVRQAIGYCRELDIESIGYFMMGNWGENIKTMEDTIRLACELDPDIAHFTIAVPLPGSPLFKTVEKDGRLLIDDWNLYGYTRGRCYFEGGELTGRLVEKMWKRAYRRFYLRPKMLKKFLFKRSTWTSPGTFLKAGLSYLGLTRN